jgi:RimJ/RimL family protein N-acetyltransferase
MSSQVMPIEFDTERLRFRPWLERDRAPFATMNADPEVMRYFPAPWTAAMSNEAIDRWLADFDSRGWSNRAVELSETREFIGFIGLSIPRRALPCTPCIEIGWRLAQARWKRGCATEGACAALAIGFERLALDEIVSFTALLYAPSRRVMERIGLRDARGLRSSGRAGRARAPAPSPLSAPPGGVARPQGLTARCDPLLDPRWQRT